MVGQETALEPVYADRKEWERVKCERFLDTERTGLVGRVIWVPEWEWVPKGWRRVWGEMCVLRRRVERGGWVGGWGRWRTQRSP